MAIFKCSVVGLGKLGACMAAAIASKNIQVYGVDMNPHLVEVFNKKKSPAKEPHMAKYMSLYGHRIKAANDYKRAIKETDLTFVVVPTPSEKDGNFSLRYLTEAAKEIGRILATKNKYHLVVITSTVPPGSMDCVIKPLLERASKKRCGRDFGLCYSPEFIALGSVIYDFLNPDFCLIGESDKKAGDRLERYYKKIYTKKPPVKRMSFINAEIAKIALNTYVTTKITYANSLARLCEQLPGADVDVVTAAIGLDSRIGRRYLTGGLGYGGPCFPRDNAALACIAARSDAPFALAECTDRTNRKMAAQLVQKITSYVRTGHTIAVLGLSYKPLTDVIEKSQGFYLVSQLVKRGYKVIVYDPVVSIDKCGLLSRRVRPAKSIHEVLHKSDVVIIVNRDPAFMKIKAKDFPRKRRSPIVVIDCWRILFKRLSNIPHIKYVPLGICQDKKGKMDVLFPMYKNYLR